MQRFKITLRIVSTNWIHLAGFYISTYLSFLLFKAIGVHDFATEEWDILLSLSLISIPFLFFTYGLMFMAGFFGVLISLDCLLFNLFPDRVRQILIFEWFAIIPPFIYWALEYDYWLWLSLIISFLATQFIRQKWLIKIQQPAGPN